MIELVIDTHLKAVWFISKKVETRVIIFYQKYTQSSVDDADELALATHLFPFELLRLYCGVQRYCRERWHLAWLG